MPLTRLLRIALLALGLIAPAALPAQGLFQPVIYVDDAVITAYELDQRIRLLRLFNTPGDLQEIAREQLIEDRLKQQALDAIGMRITEEALAAELENFAGRANLSYDQFVTVLNQNGVDEATLRDFVRIGVSWRDYIRQKYRGRVEISEADVDRALGGAAGTGVQIEVLLSEIIIPAPPPQAARANAIAAEIATYTSTARFEAAAREYSALPSRANGGRLGWLPLSNFPAPLRPLFLGLKPGEVTPPIPIPNGVALFQLRDIREVPGGAPTYGAIEYATFFIPGGRSEAALAEAARIAERVDTCDDLYGVARGLPEERLQRDALPPSEIPQAVALELARLDEGEVSYALTTADGQALMFLMLCGRSPAFDGEINRDGIRTQLLSRRLEGLANAELAQLRAAASIRFQ